MKEEEFPALYRSADDLSSKSQKHFFLALGAHLSLLVIAATLSVMDGSSSIIAIAKFISFLGTLGCSIYLYIKRPDQTWYSARAMAESIKTITWRYVCRAEPFEMDNTTAKTKFTEKIQEIFNQNKEVCKQLRSNIAGEQHTKVMQQLRSQTLEDRKRTYKNTRIQDQLTWYVKKAEFNRKKANYFFIGLIVVNLLAALSSLFHVAFTQSSYFLSTGILIALAGGVLSWMQAKKFSELASSYTLTANEIGIINEQSLEAENESDFSMFVSDAESAFSREHTQWAARKNK